MTSHQTRIKHSHRERVVVKGCLLFLLKPLTVYFVCYFDEFVNSWSVRNGSLVVSWGLCGDQRCRKMY